MGNVNYTITGNADNAEREVAKLRAQFEKLEMRLRESASAQRAASKESLSNFDKQIASLKTMAISVVSIQTAWNLARTALSEFNQLHQKVQADRSALATTERETEIKLKNQGMLSDAETKRTIEASQKESLRMPVDTVHNSKRAMEEMFSQGFDREEVISGKALRAFLELRAATNQYGQGSVDSKELVKSLATSLRNTEGRDPTAPIKAAELRDFGEAFQALFLTQSIQLPDAIPFARIQSVLTQRGIDRDTQLAAFTVAVDSFGSGDVAATYLQQATAYMGRAGTKNMEKKLAKRGIKDIDTSGFDLVGEDLVEALGNLNKMFSAMPQAQRVEVADALFGTKAQAGVMTLMGKSENIATSRQRIRDALNGGITYDQSLASFVSSDAASEKTSQIRKDIRIAEGLSSQKGLTFEDVERIKDSVHQRMVTEGSTMDKANMILETSAANLGYYLQGGMMSPEEYLESLKNPMGIGSTVSERMYNKEYQESFDPELRARRRQIDAAREIEEGAVQGGANVPLILPENIEVQDPAAVEAIEELNDTMGSIRDLLQSGMFDRSGIVRIPGAVS